MKPVANVKPIQEDLETTAEFDEEHLDNMDTDDRVGGTFELVGDENVSQSYDQEDDAENSPHVANVVPGKGTKRKPIEQEVVKEKGRQARKKLKSPKQKPSIFDSDSDAALTTSTAPKPTKAPAKGQKVAAKDGEGAAVPLAKATKKGPLPGKGRNVVVAKNDAKESDDVSDDPPADPLALPEPIAKKAVSVTKAPGPRMKFTKGTGMRILRARTEIEKAPIKIKVPMPVKAARASPSHIPLKEMIDQTMEVLNNPRKGVSFFEIKRHLASTFQYDNLNAIKKSVKARIASGDFVKVRGTGLTGSIKLAPKAKGGSRKSTSSNTDAAPVSGKKVRGNSKPINAMTEVKPNKRRKSVNVKAVKTPKSTNGKKKEASKEAKEKKPKAKNAPKAAKKAVAKKTSGKVKVGRPVKA